MKKQAAFLILLVFCILFGSLSIPISASENIVADTVALDDKLLVHYDFKGTTIAEKLTDKATGGSTDDRLNVPSVGTVVSGGIAHIATGVPLVCYFNAGDGRGQDLVARDLTELTFYTSFKVESSSASLTKNYRDLFNLGAGNLVRVCLFADSDRDGMVEMKYTVGGDSNFSTYATVDYTEDAFVKVALTMQYQNEAWNCQTFVSYDGGRTYETSDIVSYSADADFYKTAANLRLGHNNKDGSELFDIDDFRIYNKALSITELQSLSKQVLCHGFQISRLENDTYSVRFVGSIDSLRYSEVGFVITAKSEFETQTRTWDVAASRVYKTLLGYTDNGIVSYSAQSLRDEPNAYLYALSIHNIPISAGKILFTVQTYYVSEESNTRVYGERHTVPYINAVYQKPTTPYEISVDNGTSFDLLYDPSEYTSEQISKLDQYIESQLGVSVTTITESSAQSNKEIVFGSVDTQTTDNLLTQDGDYVAGIFTENKIVISANDKFGTVLALTKWVECMKQLQTTAGKFSVSNNIYGNTSSQPQDQIYKNAVVLAKEIYGTYSSWVEYQLLEKMSSDDQADQALIEALIDRLESGFAISVGNSGVLYDGYMAKLDTTDYTKVAKRSSEGHLLIAKEFAEKYFEDALTADADGYVDISAYCEASDSYSLYYNEDKEIAIVCPSDVTSFNDLEATVNGYTNLQYVERMYNFFHNEYLPEPGTNAEQTRVEIAGVRYDSDFVYDYKTEIYDCFASPAILAVKNGNETTLYVTYELSKVTIDTASHTISSGTYLKKSTDGGKTWETIEYVGDMIYASLVELKGEIYMLGNRYSDGSVMVAKYDPTNRSFESSDLGISIAGSAPTAIAVANERIYRAYNWGVISASVNDDLLSVSSWTQSNKPKDVLTHSDFMSATNTTFSEPDSWLEEGNVIVGADNKLYVLYRVNASPYWGYAAIFELSVDGKTLTPVSTPLGSGIIRLPSNQSKFMIKYDASTEKYLSFTSVTTGDSAHQRNVLALIASDDLLNWEIIDYVLVERQMMNNTLSAYAHAFQYVDFAFVGDDIVFIVRESVGDSCNYHNANCITLYTLANYTAFINNHFSNDN